MKKTNVFLVGAGPGETDLITLRGLECIRRADCIIYDRLIADGLLDYAKDGCEKIYVGKAAGKHYAAQEEINAILLEKARAGGTVVRLKGGDPYVFGRGGEEALCLREAGIPFEVVPGVTSAIAGPCFAGIPVTHRAQSRAVHIVTAHTREGGLSEADYQRLAPLTGTLVFLMGLSQTAQIADGLMRCGKAGETPAAVISCAGTPRQKTVTADLAHLAAETAAAQLPSPAVIVVGETVALREELDFFENRPLWGRRILVTSDSRRAGGIAGMLGARGAEAISVPMLELRPRRGALDGALKKLNTYTHLVFTSGNTVEFFVTELFAAGLDLRAMHALKICAVGPATERKLREHGLRADFVPEKHSGAGMLEALSGMLNAGDSVLLPQSAQAKPTLRDGLAAVCGVNAITV